MDMLILLPASPRNRRHNAATSFWLLKTSDVPQLHAVNSWKVIGCYFVKICIYILTIRLTFILTRYFVAVGSWFEATSIESYTLLGKF